MNILKPHSGFVPREIAELDMLDEFACWWGMSLEDIPDTIGVYMDKWGQFFENMFESHELVDAAAALMTYSDIFAQYLMEMGGEEIDYLGYRVNLIRRMFMRSVNADYLTVPGMVLQDSASVRWEAKKDELEQEEE